MAHYFTVLGGPDSHHIHKNIREIECNLWDLKQ